MGETFCCPGCRQMFTVASSDGSKLTQVCPIPECRRVLWVRGAPNNGFGLETPSAPDLSGARFVCDQMRLLDAGVVLLSGPADCLKRLADHLNELDPAEIDLPDLVRQWIQTFGRGCTFLPGYALVHAGYAALDAKRNPAHG